MKSNNINQPEQKKNVKTVVKKKNKSSTNNTNTSDNLDKVSDYEDCCNICTDKFTGMVRKCISCPNCFFKQCRDCVKKYFLNIRQDPHCMNCKVEWKKNFCFEVLPKVFLEGEYKKHREDVLLDREKSFLIETMPYAERKVEEEKLEKEISKLMMERDKILNQFEKEISSLRKLRYYLNDNKPDRKEFVRKCPVDQCNGFLSTQWKCGLCDTWVCPDCLEIKGKEKNIEHVCNVDFLETAKVLKKETKPCPKCSSPIFKISGCSQIWCTQCHTAFDYQTGKIESIIHNPHYFEYMSKIGNVPRQPGDIPCGGRPYVQEINRIINIFHNQINVDPAIKNLMSNFLRMVNHIDQYEIVNNNQDPTVANRDLRINYILKKLEEDVWKKELQVREKKYERSKSMDNINNTVVMAGSDILQRFLNVITIEDYINIICETEYLRLYTNEEFFNHSKIFSCNSSNIITDSWIYYNKINKTKISKDPINIDEEVAKFRVKLNELYLIKKN